jgi:hypothetical protein
MAYRGDDLDLRTPQTWSASSESAGGPEAYTNGGGRARGASYSRPAPILVDDIVLACSNHAFDVAVAHRAGDVRLEHLLHAMTRVEGASNALEARGIRVPGLRRESATIIAGEIPIGLGGSQVRPHRSDDFEQALRTASAIAYRRNAPANVDDLLDALLDMPSDISGIALLARHGGRIARDRLPQREIIREREPARDREPARTRETLRERERELLPLAPLTRAVTYTAEPRLADPREHREMRKPQPDFQADAPRSSRADLVGTQVDGIQNARIDQLENALRALATDLANDRSVMREDTSRFHGGLHDRLQSLEQSVRNSGGNDGDAEVLLDRLAAVERGLEQRLSELSRPWGVLTDRLQGLEQTLLETRGAKGSDVTIVADRVAGLERGLFDRMKGLERTVDGALNRTIDFGPIANRLDIIEEAVLSPAGNPESDKLTEKVVERLRVLEDAISNQRALVAQSNQALSGDVKQLASVIAGHSASTERVQSFVSDRIQTLTAGFDRQREDVTVPVIERINALGQMLDGRLTGPLTERMNAMGQSLDGRLQSFDGRLQSFSGLMDRQWEQQRTEVAAPLLERVTALTGAVDTRGTETQRTLATLVERMLGLEAHLKISLDQESSLKAAFDQMAQTLVAQAAQAAEVQAAHTAELKEVHEALIKLNTNQHTLAGSIDQWRLDGVGDISVIANRLEGIEKSTGKPIQMIEALTTSVDNINRATVERYHRRNRFWYWLFGTDDWVTASWPSQVASVEAERNALRGSKSAPSAGQFPTGSGLPKSLQR